jgi:hypothetical protein
MCKRGEKNMNPHVQQYFHLLLAMASDRLSERIIHRNEGIQKALERLRDNPQGEGIWLNEFVDAFFHEILLDNPAGYCLILHSLANQPVDEYFNMVEYVTVGEMLEKMAKQIFAILLHRKTKETLEQTLAFGGE